MRRFLVAGLIGGLLALPLATAAQDSGVPYDQVRREYRSMSPVHIKKCDYDNNGFYNNVVRRRSSERSLAGYPSVQDGGVGEMHHVRDQDAPFRGTISPVRHGRAYERVRAG